VYELADLGNLLAECYPVRLLPPLPLTDTEHNDL
jgi:hypothetical protein